MRSYARKPYQTQSLPADTRSKSARPPAGTFGPRFAHDFSRVPAYGRGGETFPFRDRIELAFGRHDIHSARAHTGSRAADAARMVGAKAFTIGDDVAFDGMPDLRTAAHEAAHVVQQRSGVLLGGGIGRPGDPYERQADAVADRVVRNQPAEELLDAIGPAKTSPADGRVLQRMVSSKYGDFDTDKYDAAGPAGKEYGVDIELTFDPGPKVDATQIGLTQTVRDVLGGKVVALHPSIQDKVVPSGTGEGRAIDRRAAGAFGNPLYATGEIAMGDTLSITPADPEWGQHGYNYVDKGGTVRHQKALIKDTPALAPVKKSEQVFETAALAIEGAQSGTYMGSVEWGWRIDDKGIFTKLPLKLISADVPSAAFMSAAKQWNKSTTTGTIKTVPKKTNVYDAKYAVAFKVDKDTEVEVTDDIFIHAKQVYNDVHIRSGPNKGKTGRIKTNDMKDTGGGSATIPLPIHRISTIKTATAGPVELRGGRGTIFRKLADLTGGTTVKVLEETGTWIEIEVDTTQTGVTLNSGTKADNFNLVRGFVPAEAID